MQQRPPDAKQLEAGPRHPTRWAAALMGAACGLAWLLAGCASTESAPPQRYSGFLEDYSILSPREGSDGAALRFIKPGARLGRFERLLIERVIVYYGVGTGLHDIPEQDLETLANHLYSALVRHLGADYPLVERPVVQHRGAQYPVVEQPGPDVLRVQVALTEAQPSDVVINAVSSALPIRPLSDLKQLTTGTQAFVGTAGIEAKIVDAASGELLAAAVDRRQGGKRLEDAQGGWGDVLAAFDFWATELRRVLAEAREQERGAVDTR
jgi:hypothetical protein